MWQPVELTPAQEKAWEDTRVSLLRHCPAFAHIFYTLLNNSGTKKLALFSKDVPIAATDGRNVIINPDTFFEYTLHERVFIVAHEILHCILNHIGLFFRCKTLNKVVFPDGKELPWNVVLMNIAADYVVNAILVESNTGKFNPAWIHDTSIATAQDSVLDTYRKLFKNAKKITVSPGGSGSGKPGDGQFDQHLDPGTSEGQNPHDAAQKRNEAQWRAEINAAMQTAKLKGDLPKTLQRLFDETIEPQVSWQEYVRSFFARREAAGSYNWRRPDRRLIVRDIYAPARSSYGAGLIVVAIDTSGSIGNDELSVFAAELGGIFEQLRPRELWVMWCDAHVHRMDEIEDMSDFYRIKKEGGLGGGGTSFVPVFEKLFEEGMQPDLLIYLTDGLGTFPDQPPPYDTLWGATLQGVHYPFGNVVDLPMGRNARS